MCHKTAKKTCNARLSLNRISSVWYNTGVALLIPGNGKVVRQVDFLFVVNLLDYGKCNCTLHLQVAG